MDASYYLTMSESLVQARTVKVLASTQVLNGLGVAGTVAAGSLLVASITGSETLAGLAQTTSVLGAAALALPLARLTARGGRRLALSIGLIAGVIGSLFAILGGIEKNVFLMLTGTFLVGSASAAGYQARFAAIDLASDEHRAKQLSIVVWGATVGAVAGPNLMEPAGAIAEAVGWPRLVGPYMVAAVALTLAVLVIQLFLRPDPYLLAAKRDSAETSSGNKGAVRPALKSIRETPLALFAILSIAIGHVAMVSVMVMTPVHMAHVEVTLTIIGLVLSVHVIGMYAFSPIVGQLSDRLGRVKAIQVGVIILLASLVISGFARADDSLTLGIGLFLLGLGWSFTLIAGSALLTEAVNPAMRSASQGASDLVMNLSGAAGGALAGVIIGVFSYGWLCVAASIPVAYLGYKSLRLTKETSDVAS